MVFHSVVGAFEVGYAEPAKAGLWVDLCYGQHPVQFEDDAHVRAQIATHNGSQCAWYWRPFRQKIGIDPVGLGGLAQPVTTDHAGIGQWWQAKQLLSHSA